MNFKVIKTFLLYFFEGANYVMKELKIKACKL